MSLSAPSTRSRTLSLGGFLAVCLTDFVQGVIMMLALILMPAALLAAIMSTVSSQLLVSSSLAEDVYRLLVNKKASDKAIVTVGRIAVVAVGAGEFRGQTTKAWLKTSSFGSSPSP